MKVFHSRRVGALLLLACPAAATAQVVQATASPKAASCLDRIPVSALTRVAVYAYVDVRDSVSTTFSQTADNFLQELVERLQRQLGSSDGKLPIGEPAVTWRGSDDRLHLVAYKDGRILVVDRDSLGAATTAALAARALDGISTVGEIMWSADSARDSVHFDIRFVRPTVDSAGGIHKPRVKREAIPVFSILAPWERQIAPKPGQDHPEYPDHPRREGYEATIVLSFLVDSTGHTIRSSIRDVWPKEKPRLKGRDLEAYQDFLEETERTAANFEFIPAEIGGCPVKQLVQMPFVFQLRR